MHLAIYSEHVTSMHLHFTTFPKVKRNYSIKSLEHTYIRFDTLRSNICYIYMNTLNILYIACMHRCGETAFQMSSLCVFVGCKGICCLQAAIAQHMRYEGDIRGLDALHCIAGIIRVHNKSLAEKGWSGRPRAESICWFMWTYQTREDMCAIMRSMCAWSMGFRHVLSPGWWLWHMFGLHLPV